MKKAFFYAFMLLFTAFFATSCISKYDVNLPDVEKTLVVNAFLMNDTTEQAVVQVSQAISTLSNTWSLPDTTKAVVEIFENGVKLQRLKNVSTDLRYYSAEFVPYKAVNFAPKAGKTYTISVKMRYFEAVSAEQVMPPDMPTFTTVFHDSLGVASFGGPLSGKQPVSGVAISFTDNAATEDYYEINAYTQDSVDFGFDGHFDILNNYLRPASISSPSTILEQTARGNQGSLLLSDQTINGQYVNFNILSSDMGRNIRYENGSPSKVEKRFIRISHLTKDRYLYLKSIQKQQDSNNSPFSEPVYVYSNVSSKFGVFLLANGRLQACD
ncbi:MAG: hypothetical protein RI894_1121 [Bacteroidota bacterium]|jgi:hypothetical protein